MIFLSIFVGVITYILVTFLVRYYLNLKYWFVGKEHSGTYNWWYERRTSEDSNTFFSDNTLFYVATFWPFMFIPFLVYSKLEESLNSKISLKNSLLEQKKFDAEALKKKLEEDT